MKNFSCSKNRLTRGAIFASVLPVLVLSLAVPRSASAQLTLANPHWNITLTDAGYSDFLLDNTPGFEGREYLSGEWGAAVGYQVAGQPVTAPMWLEKYFTFPDWTNNSAFSVVTPLTQVALNADNLPIAESVIKNGDLQITLRHEMLDTILGTPMGIAAASGSLSNSIQSSRYVLKQTAIIKNISGASISGLQFFQFVHGLHSQRGFYDDRNHPGYLSNYHYDVTLSGVDPYSVGTNTSSLGLEDFLGFHSSIPPSGFEIGYFGIEGNGIDDHWQGKPSEGVHLSIEDNWQNAPYNGRLGTDFFEPPHRWVSGAQRFDLGTLAAGQSASLDIVLSLRTGTQVVIGTGSSGSCNGGSSVPGGEDYEFEDVSSPGSCFGEYSQASADEVSLRLAAGEFEPFTFLQPGGLQQIWKMQFTGVFDGSVHLTFGYDPTILPGTLDQSALVVYQFDGGTWQKLPTMVDTARHTLTVTTRQLTVFALGVDGGLSWEVNTSVLPPDAGTASGGGARADGTSATLAAKPNAGYVFSSWTEEGGVVSTSPGYSFIVRTNRSLVANFVPVGENYALATSATPPEGGATLGDGAYPPGATATVVALPNPGYKFSKWLVNGVAVSLSRTNYFTVSSNTVMVAKFKPVYSMVVTAQPQEGGELEADPFYEMGELAKLKAKPFAGFCFVNWTQNGIVVSTDPNYSFNVTGNRSLTGNFAFGNMVRANAYPGLGGAVTGAGVYQQGGTVDLTAEANPGYKFLNWTENGQVVSDSQSYSFNSTGSRTLEANFVAGGLPASVTLDVQLVAGNLVLSWPASDSSTLQRTPDLGAPSWTAVTNGIVMAGDRKQFTDPATNGAGFFRLAKP